MEFYEFVGQVRDWLAREGLWPLKKPIHVIVSRDLHDTSAILRREHGGNVILRVSPQLEELGRRTGTYLYQESHPEA